MGNITYSLQKKLGKTTSNISVDHLSQALELTDKKATTKLKFYYKGMPKLQPVPIKT